MKRPALLLLCLALLASLLASCSTGGACQHLHIRSNATLPTCSVEGYITHVCPDCGYTYKSDFASPIGHSIVYAVVQPTCEEVGYTTFTCRRCDYSYQSEVTAPLGHNLVSSLTPPTCEDEGYTEFSCLRCDYSYKAEYTSPAGHIYTDKTVAATCLAAGYTEHRCTVCDHTYTSDYVDALGHAFQKKITAPTCLNVGYTQYTCKTCSLSYRTDYTSATGHRFVVSTTSPTLTSPGYLHNRCSVCGVEFDSEPVYYSELLLSAGNTGKTVLAKGVDLSHHNGNVDFVAMKKAGIDFVILRAGFYGTGEDPKFEAYYAAATAAGLDVGCYLYTESLTVAGIKSDVKKLLGYLGGKQLAYPIYLDMETAAQKALSSGQLINMAKTFAELLLDAGYFPGLYTNPDWLKVAYGAANDPTLVMDVWLAHHNPTTYRSNPNYYAGKYGMWQYCGTENTEFFERIPGIDGRVDIDVCYKDYPAIIKAYGYNGY